MTLKHNPDSQFDLFVPYVSDLPLRDQRETMERPFFSLSKRKRLQSIEYTSPDGQVYVKVAAHQDFGMATIWDADILIWAASTISHKRKQGVNDISRKLEFMPYELLKTIGRDTGGDQYQRLREALERLQATTISTNIRMNPRRKKRRQFSWIEEWTDTVDEQGGQSKGMSLTLSDWLYEGILMDGGLLAIDPAYFSITSGRERWLYRTARKHAGGNGPDGFTIPFKTLFEKSGAEGTFRRFKFEIHGIVKRNALPGYHLEVGATKDDDTLRMIRRDLPADWKPKQRKSRAKAVNAQAPQQAALPLFRQRSITDHTRERIRRDFPGWDLYFLQSEFDQWLCDNPEKSPENYEAAFYGFVRQFDARERHARRS
jgi:plasmid replication initiation protein